MTTHVEAGVLDVAYLESGPRHGPPVILLHGFPYDVRCYEDVAPRLAGAGCRVIVPWLRGYGGTRFLDEGTPRSGEQAVLAHDLLALMDALDTGPAVLAGYDWGGRAACIVAALWPERARGLVSGEGYNIQDIPHANEPAAAATEHRLWYQYYFHAERGRAGLERNRRDICRLLWKLWSPDWRFDDATFERTAASFDNPDFVDVVIHSYRHRYGLVEGDPAVLATERRLQAQPDITVPAVILRGASDGVVAVGPPPDDSRHFRGPTTTHTLPGVGHNLPQEAPAAFSEAVLSLL